MRRVMGHEGNAPVAKYHQSLTTGAIPPGTALYVRGGYKDDIRHAGAHPIRGWLTGGTDIFFMKHPECSLTRLMKWTGHRCIGR